MHITKPAIRVTEKYVLIDVVVDGNFSDGFVLYDGNTDEHIGAAYSYLSAVGFKASDIAFDDQSDVLEGWKTGEPTFIDISEGRVEPHITF